MSKKYKKDEDVTVQLEATIIDRFDDEDILVRPKRACAEHKSLPILIRDDDIVSED